MITTRKNHRMGTLVSFGLTVEYGERDLALHSKWATKCEAHDVLCGADTRAQARAQLARVDDWCSHCKARVQRMLTSSPHSCSTCKDDGIVIEKAVPDEEGVIHTHIRYCSCPAGDKQRADWDRWEREQALLNATARGLRGEKPTNALEQMCVEVAEILLAPDPDGIRRAELMPKHQAIAIWSERPDATADVQGITITDAGVSFSLLFIDGHMIDVPAREITSWAVVPEIVLPDPDQYPSERAHDLGSLLICAGCAKSEDQGVLESGVTIKAEQVPADDLRRYRCDLCTRFCFPSAVKQLQLQGAH